MEIRIVIFLSFVCVVVISNTLLILFAYKAFVSVTSKVTEGLSELSKTGEARVLINALYVAAEQAAAVTESTKLRITEFDPVLGRAQENYRRTLVALDSKLETFAGNLDTTARTVRDMVAKPAFSVVTFAAGISRVLDSSQK